MLTSIYSFIGFIYSTNICRAFAIYQFRVLLDNFWNRQGPCPRGALILEGETYNKQANIFMYNMLSQSVGCYEEKQSTVKA